MTAALQLSVRRLLARWDSVAYEQLCARAAALAQENEDLRRELDWAEQAAESWRDHFLRATEDMALGLTQDGLVHVMAKADCHG